MYQQTHLGQLLNACVDVNAKSSSVPVLRSGQLLVQSCRPPQGPATWLSDPAAWLPADH